MYGPQSPDPVIAMLVAYGNSAQVDTCGCEKRTQHHLPPVCQDFCYNVDGCQHTPRWWIYGRLSCPQIKNPKNFGSMGISECGINIKRMPPFSQAREIDDAGCDIFLWEVLPLIPSTTGSIPTKRLFPTLCWKPSAPWSMACDRNLVVVAQAEAKPGAMWQNKNVNPNTAISDPSKFSIFNGIFGSLQEFKQGHLPGCHYPTTINWNGNFSQGCQRQTNCCFDVATKDLILEILASFAALQAFYPMATRFAPATTMIFWPEISLPWVVKSTRVLNLRRT